MLDSLYMETIISFFAGVIALFYGLIGYTPTVSNTQPAPVVVVASTTEQNVDLDTTNKFTADDQKRGWYYGDKDQKKLGTPSNWILKDAGTRSAMWKAPVNAFKPAY